MARRVLPLAVLGAALAVGAQAQRMAPTFYRDVLPILQERCQSCHRAGEIAPMPLVTYAQTRAYSRQIRAETTSRRMPPWFADPRYGHFSNDPSLTTAQIATLAAWAAAGAPAGNPRDAPPPRQWAQGWVIPQPDAVVKMPKPVPLPARGMVDYTYEIVPTGFTEDKWVRMSEIRPERRGNVHHAVVYIRPPGSEWLKHAPVGEPFTSKTLTDLNDRRDAMSTKSDMLLVYAPGSSPDEWPEGMAKLVPRGSDLVFQMHYISNGKATEDQTSIGMVFSKTPPAKRVLTLQLANDTFVIPPGDPDYYVESHGTLPHDALLLSFFPHMHLRGKEFTYNIVHPQKDAPPAVEPLLHVNYNFYWQLSYRLATPLPLKAGTELQAAAVFDNSRRNPHNPDPDAAVTWGDQTTDEMMVGFFDVAVDPTMDKSQFFDRGDKR